MPQFFRFFNVATGQISVAADQEGFEARSESSKIATFARVLRLERWNEEEVVCVGNLGLIVWVCEGRTFAEDESKFRQQQWVAKIWG